MKKLSYALALATIMLLGSTNTSLACEGGKCKMEHADKKDKSKKGKKGAKAESCHATTIKEGSTAGSAETKSCCVKKETTKPADTKAN